MKGGRWSILIPSILVSSKIKSMFKLTTEWDSPTFCPFCRRTRQRRRPFSSLQIREWRDIKNEPENIFCERRGGPKEEHVRADPHILAVTKLLRLRFLACKSSSTIWCSRWSRTGVNRSNMFTPFYLVSTLSHPGDTSRRGCSRRSIETMRLYPSWRWIRACKVSNCSSPSLLGDWLFTFCPGINVWIPLTNLTNFRQVLRWKRGSKIQERISARSEEVHWRTIRYGWRWKWSTRMSVVVSGWGSSLGRILVIILLCIIFCI